MYEAIPLAAALRVELDSVVPYQFVLGKGKSLVSRRWASWNRYLAAVQGPADLWLVSNGHLAWNE